MTEVTQVLLCGCLWDGTPNRPKPPTDSLFPDMSVTDMLLYQASLVMPRTTSYAQRAKRIEHLLVMLSLMSVAHRRCEVLSHGERRRVSLGLALLQRPKVLLLDEPFADNDAYVQDELLQVGCVMGCGWGWVLCAWLLFVCVFVFVCGVHVL